MASPGNKRPLAKSVGINRMVEKKLEGILSDLQGTADDNVTEKLQETLNFIAAMEPYAISKSTPLSPLLKYVIEETAKLDFKKLKSEGQMKYEMNINIPVLKMITANGQVQLLQFLNRQINAKNILEVGSYTGYAAFGMAEVMVPEGKVTTIEMEPFFCKFINRTAEERNLNVEAIEGAALVVLDSLAKDKQKYDFIYVDCEKQEYSDYYRIIMDNDMLDRGGILACDNVIYSGRAIAKKDAEGVALDEFSTMVLKDERVTSVMLPCFDGLLLIQHKK